MIYQELKQIQNYQEPITSTRFHKKSYVEGQVDYFVGISMPDIRTLAKKYYLSISELELNNLLTDKIHEYRLLGLVILSNQMKNNLVEQKKVVEKYLDYLDYVDNWDLVDCSAASILGRYLYQIEDYELLYELSFSDNLWYKRVSIVSTWYLIKKGFLDVTLDLVDNLMSDTHHLIHKACGWMLRELGKKDKELLTEYLNVNYQDMPRTMLRYAIEKYPENIRKKILKGDFSWR
jgi:3-methyladenine DNA glycosylase AlkD